MKKKFVLMCMAGAVTASLAACGKSDKEAQQTSQTAEALETDSASEESADSGTQTEEESAGGREDYVELQDLDIEEYITLADYKSMKVSAVRPAVDDETVTQYIDSELLVGKITDRAVEEGDVADIDFVGKKDGVAFEGGTAAGYMLTIGSGGFIPGFEEGLVGVMPGETVDLNLTFPENYKQNPDLAGQEVVFSVKVNSIEGSAAYETVTPEEMKDLGLPYKTKEEVWEAGKEAVEERAEETFAANAKSAIVQQLVEESTAKSIPEYLIEEEVQSYNLYMESIAAMYGVDLETFVSTAGGFSMEEYDTQTREMCTEIVKQYLVMEAVARAEGIEITEEKIREQADEEAAEYGYASGDALIEQAGYTSYRMSILQDAVIERLTEIVPVEEEATQEAES
ncbi:MAG: trigger factor [Lachnospiraceae bacterium]|nr:trigger factor [Lachnospiraceae bacterium]